MSKKARKQRFRRFNALLHTRRKFVSVHISKELRTKLGTKKRNIPIRKGDKVKVVRGKFKKISGKVTKVNLKKEIIFVEGCIIKRGGGQEKLAPIQPSNVILIEADFADKQRKQILDRSVK